MSICKQTLHQLSCEHDTGTPESDELLVMQYNSISSMSSTPIMVPIQIQGHDIEIQLDTECAMSLAPKSFYDQFCADAKLQQCDNKLYIYTGEEVTHWGSVL